MVTWAELNKQKGQVKTTKTKGWNNFNQKMTQESFQQESVSQTDVDPALFQQLKSRQSSTQTINNTLTPEKTSYIKTLGKTIKDTITGFGDQMLRTIRGTSQVAATPLAGIFALPRGGATPIEAMKESLRMAKDVAYNNSVSVDKAVEDAGQMWLKNRGVGKYGGKQPDVADVAALGVLGFFNLFGDPAFEFGAGIRGVSALKEFATFKKVGQVTKEFKPGTTIVKGTEMAREIKISDDLKVKIKPKENTVVFEGYKKRFPSQKALPDSQMAKETQDLVINTREATGMEIQARLVGDDLILTPTEPIAKTVQPPVKSSGKYPTIHEGGEIKMVEGEPVKMVDGVETFLHKDENGNWVVSEATTGRNLSGGGFSNSNLAIKETKANIENVGEDKFIKLLKENKILQPAQTKTQSTDILSEVNKQPEIPKMGGETKQSKLGVRVKEEAVEDGLVKQMRGLPEYETMNMKEQAKLASELINSDLDKAKRIAMGQEMPEGKLLSESVFIGMKNWAKQNKDVDLIRQLAKSHTVEQATFMGQRIRALGETDPNDPVRIIRDIEQLRAKKLEVKPKEALTAEQKKIQREIKMVKKTEKDLEDFIQAIKC